MVRTYPRVCPWRCGTWCRGKAAAYAAKTQATRGLASCRGKAAHHAAKPRPCEPPAAKPRHVACGKAAYNLVYLLNILFTLRETLSYFLKLPISWHLVVTFDWLKNKYCSYYILRNSNMQILLCINTWMDTENWTWLHLIQSHLYTSHCMLY